MSEIALEPPKSNGVDPDAEIPLLKRLCNGDESALEALYHRYHPRLFRFIGRMTCREDLIEELINDVMFTVWEKAASYQYECKVSTWIFGIAFNKTRHALRSVRNLAEDSFEEMDMNRSEFSAQDLTLDRIEAGNWLEFGFKALSPEQRAVVELTYFQGLHYSEIALMMDCPENTVKTRMYHARKILAAQLASNSPLTGSPSGTRRG